MSKDKIIFLESDHYLGKHSSGNGSLHCNSVYTGKYEFQCSELLKNTETSKDANPWGATMTQHLVWW